jgi:hypothetical protein
MPKTHKRRKIRRFLPIKASNGQFVERDMEFMGTVDFQAAKDEKGLPKVKLQCYSGGKMRPRGYYDHVVVDLKGARFDKRVTPIIMDHDTSKRLGHTTRQAATSKGIEAEGLISSTTDDANKYVADSKNGFPFQVSIGASIRKGYFLAEGKTATINDQEWEGPLIVASKTVIRELSVTVLGADSDTSARIAAQARKGVNMDPTFEEFVASFDVDLAAMDDKTKAKWQTKYDEHLGLLHAAAENEDEDEDEPEPAPRRKPARRKAVRRTVKAGRGRNRNDIEADEDDEDDNLDRIRARRAEEDERCDAIGEIAAQYGETFKGKKVKGGKDGDGKEMSFSEIKATAIREGWSRGDFELFCVRAERPIVGNGGQVNIHTKDRNVQGRALECSLLRYYGVPNKVKNPKSEREYGLECWYKPEELEMSHERQYNVGGSIQACLDLQIRAAGRYFPGVNRGDSEFVECAVSAWNDIKASGFSTLNITNVLENTMHKQMLASYEGVESIWRFIARRRPLDDFRPHNFYRLDFQGGFKKVAVDGQLKHISMTDSKKSVQADTYGCMITIDRKTMKNDDMGGVMERASGIGTLGGLRIEESVFVLLLSNPGSFFSAGNGNLLTGGASALSITSLETAKLTYRNQVVDGKPVSNSPRILIVGTTLEQTANDLWAEDKVAVGYGNTDTGLVFVRNPHKGLYRPYVSPYLNNTGITDQDGTALSGQSGTQWYLGGDPNAPQGSAIVIGFVDGRDTPYFDQAETDFNVPGGMQFRSYLDWGNAMQWPEMMVKSAGA